MNTKHNDGYWVSKLTDENILELVKNLTADKPTKKFVQILSIKRNNNSVEIVYESKKLKSYLTYAEDKISFNDFKVSGGNKLSVYAETMISLFGEEYEEEFLATAEKYIAENENDALSKKYQKTIKDVEKLKTEVSI